DRSISPNCFLHLKPPGTRTKEFYEATFRYRRNGFLSAAGAGDCGGAGAMVDYPLAHATAAIGLFWFSGDRSSDDCGGYCNSSRFIFAIRAARTRDTGAGFNDTSSGGLAGVLVIS